MSSPLKWLSWLVVAAALISWSATHSATPASGRGAEFFGGRTINVSIETTGVLTTGMSVADYWRVTDRPHNVHFIRSVDDEGFFSLLTERLARLP